MGPQVRLRLTRSATLVTGAVGSVMVALGGSQRARLPAAPDAGPFYLLKHLPGARPAGFTLAFAGLALLTIAWLVLGRQVAGDRHGVGRVVRTTAVWVVPFLVTPPLYSNDAWSYVAEGDLVSLERSPYVATPLDLFGPVLQAVSPMWRDAHTPYGPLPMVWGGLVSDISKNPWVDLFGFRLLALASLATMAYAVAHLARRAASDPASATWLAVASPFTLIHGIGGAHLDLTMAALLSLAVLWSLRGRWVVGAALVGAAAAVKVPAVVADAPVVLASLQWTQGSAGLGDRLRQGITVAAVTIGTLLGLGALSGLGTGWVTGLASPLDHLTPLAPSTQVAVRIRQLFGVNLVGPVQDLALLALAVLVGWVALRGRAKTSGDVVRAAAVVSTATVLLSPVVHYWYFLMCLPFLASAALSRRARRVSVTATLVLGLLTPADFSAGRLPTSGYLVLLGLAVVVVSGLLPVHRESAGPTQVGGSSTRA